MELVHEFYIAAYTPIALYLKEVSDIGKIETETLLGYKIRALNVKSQENQRFIVMINKMIDERPDKDKLTSKKVKLETLYYFDV
ncbi:hypothetical protein Tco_0887787 [Tanacetum coccineum]